MRNIDHAFQHYRIAYRFKRKNNTVNQQIINILIVVAVYTAIVIIPALFLGREWTFVGAIKDNGVLLGISFVYIFIPSIIEGFFLGAQQIEVNQQGIIFQGFFFQEIPKTVAWDEVDSIHSMNDISPNQTSASKWYNRRPTSLIFTLKTGKGFILMTSGHRNALFIGEGHPLDLITVLELYGDKINAVESMSEEERKEIKALPLGINLDLGKEVGHIAYSALILILISIFLLYRFPMYALENTMLPAIFWSVGIGASLLACWYMRTINNKFHMIIPAMLFGGMMAFLMMPVINNIPAVLGHPSMETFVVREEDQTEQMWQSELQPMLTLKVHGDSAIRRFHGKGTAQKFNVYRGPFGMSAITEEDYHSLRN